MALVAIRAHDGVEIESFSIPADKWKDMKKRPKGYYFMLGSEWPAVLKRSINGIQFFAYSPGYTGTKPANESFEHIKAKTLIVNALRLAGYEAWVEKSGKCPMGESWQADVMCQGNEEQIAFEVQLAPQTLEVYEERSSRYRRSNVGPVWVVGAQGYGALIKSIYKKPENRSKPCIDRQALPNLTALLLEISGEPPDDSFAVVVFTKDQVMPSRISLAEFAVGVVEKRLTFHENRWFWE